MPESTDARRAAIERALRRDSDSLAQRLRKSILAIPGVIESPGIYDDADAFWINGTQIAHWRDPYTLELRLTKPLIRERRAELKQDPRVSLRRGASDWIMLHFDGRDDVMFAARLAIAAADAHRPRRRRTDEVATNRSGPRTQTEIPPMNKTELLALTRSERTALDDVYAKLTEDELCAPVLDGKRSMKDELAHIAGWERRIVRATAAADRGETDVWPEPGYTMADIDRLNERDYLASRDRALGEVVADARASFADYAQWIAAFSDEQIAGELPYTPGIKLESIIRANGDQHYREHLDQIEAWWAGQGG